MSQAPQFVISEFTNPSGEIVFRLTGWLDGKRIRKNFPTRAEAGAERQAMEIQQLQTEIGSVPPPPASATNSYTWPRLCQNRLMIPWV